MSEPSWTASTNPQSMLSWLSNTSQAEERKLRLFAAACCRRHWDLLTAEGRRAVDLMELAADGLGDRRAQAAFKHRNLPLSSATSFGVPAFFAGAAVTALLSDHHPNPLQQAQAVSSWAAGAGRSWAEEQAAQADILRDLVRGVPFVDAPALGVIERRWIDWNEATVGRLARAIYDRHAFEQMPILADAKEEGHQGPPQKCSKMLKNSGNPAVFAWRQSGRDPVESRGINSTLLQWEPFPLLLSSSAGI